MDLDKNIEDYDLVFLDLETTGLDVVMGDAICEIGAFKVRKRKVIDKFHSLINPKKNIPEEAYRIHKISDKELKAAPSLEEVADSFLCFLKNCVLCAYNIEFDLGFIDYSLKRINYPPLGSVAIDILAMARDALTLPRYNLEIVAKSLRIECRGDLHRALDDAALAWEIFLKIIDIFKEKKIEKLEDYFSLYSYDNEVFRTKENYKLAILKEAIAKNKALKMKYFSKGQLIESKQIFPLQIFQEAKAFYLLYQGSEQNSSRIRLRRILAIEEIEQKPSQFL